MMMPDKKENMRKKLADDIAKLWDEKHGYLTAGWPRFRRMFGRDALIASWQLLKARPDIAGKSLAMLARLQGVSFNDASEEEPGKIIHETDFAFSHHPKHPGMPFPYYGSVDSTPLFVIVAFFYLQTTGDKALIETLRPNIKAAVELVARKLHEDETGFLRYENRHLPDQLFHQGWKDDFSDHLGVAPPVAIVEAQGYAYCALRCAAQLFSDDAARYEQEAATLKKRFLPAFFMEKERYFALALDGRDRQSKKITSNPGHLLFTGMVDGGHAELIVCRLFRDDLWTPFGIRTYSTRESDFDERGYHHGTVWPHDNWIIAQGLRRCERMEEYEKVRRALIGAYEVLGEIPELFCVTDGGDARHIEGACPVQAWSSGALLDFITGQ